VQGAWSRVQGAGCRVQGAWSGQSVIKFCINDEHRNPNRFIPKI
jgi:hypothetical protein